MNEEAVVVVHDAGGQFREGSVVRGERKAALASLAGGLVVLPVSPLRLGSTLAAMAAGSYVRRSLPGAPVLPGPSDRTARVSAHAPLNLYLDAGEQRVHLALAVRAQRVPVRGGSLRLSSRSAGLSLQPGEPVELGRLPLECDVVLRHEARAVADAPGLATVALSGLVQGVELLWVAATVVGE